MSASDTLSASRTPIHVAVDEWNVWYRTRTHETRVAGIEERYDLTDALAVATYLNGFIRHCRTVRIGNLAQLVNAIAPIFTSPRGLFPQTIYHPLRLYAEHTREVGALALLLPRRLSTRLRARLEACGRATTFSDHTG